MKLVELTAAEFCTSVRDGTHDSPKPVDGDGKPLVTTRHMKNGRISLDDAYLISQSDFDKVNDRSQVHQWDVLISMIGTLGELVLVRDEPDYAIKNIGLFKTKSKYDGMWLYYYLQSPSAKNHIFTSAQGSTQQYLSLKTLRNFPVSVPECETDKRAVCEFLGTLDDKIELNQKMNQTLEDIAKAIFKSWFVDFDPVRAKAEGRSTGLPDEINDLFPDAFEDSEIGEIPVGWKITSLGDQTTLTKGRSYKSAELMDSDTALVTLKSFHRGGGYRLDGLKSYTGTYKEDQVLQQGDLIIALTDVTQAADVIGKPAIVRSSSDYSTLVASLDVGIIRAKAHSDITREFCYFLMLTDRYTQHSLGYTTGTTVLHLAKDASAKFEIGLPHKAVIDHFTAIASPLMQRIFAAEKENEILSELRDTLLPKLISGDLRIPDAEKFLEEAGI
jgi:type I restriction enzyme, S subunit